MLNLDGMGSASISKAESNNICSRGGGVEFFSALILCRVRHKTIFKPHARSLGLNWQNWQAYQPHVYGQILSNLLLNTLYPWVVPEMCAGDMSSSVSDSGACLAAAATDADADGVWRVSSLATLGAITSESRVMYAHGLLLHIGNTVNVG